MTLEAAFADMMTSTVTVYASDTVDAYGKSTYDATGVEWQCRIQERIQKYPSENNRDVFENGSIIFYGDPDITTDSKIVLPDGSSPVILSVTKHLADDGPHHTTVVFGK